MSSSGSFGLIRCLAVAAVLAAPGLAAANVARSSYGGMLGGEPAGIRDIAIHHEELAIDVRALAGDPMVAVTATYHLDNQGGAATLDLVFAGGTEWLRDFRVMLDGAAVEAPSIAPAEGAIARPALPPSWRAPATTPLPEGGELDFGIDRSAVVGFQLAVPPGAHTLAVSYRADALHRRGEGPALLHQFAYVLAPARSWAGFGGLDVTIQVPAGWAAAVSPAMARTGDTLHAAFDRLPADSIGLTVHAATGAYTAVAVVVRAGFALVVVGGGFAIALWARRSARRRHGLLPYGAAWGLSLLWCIAFGAAGLAAIFVPDWMLPEHQQGHHGYGQGFAGIAVVLAALVAFPIGAWIAHAAARRAVNPADPVESSGA